MKDGKYPLFMRLTINGIRWDTALQLGVKETSWDAKKQQAKPDDKDSKIVNDKIDSLLYRVHKAKLRLDDEGKEVTINHIKDLLSDREKEAKTILTLFKKHNMECEQKSWCPSHSCHL
ncbi:MAG: hypothetical protein IPN67_19470 [Bacteroidales bacterium]|nr:hypothetical protein [Bacteroidales bacterium]